MTVEGKVLAKQSSNLEEGACFIDSSGSMNGLVWFIEGEIKAGDGQTAGKRILALYQDKDGHIRQILA